MLLFNLLEGEATGKNDYTMLIVLGVIVVAFIVMSIVNNKNRKKQMAEDQKRKDSLCKGTKIITIGGIIGTVVSVDHENNTFVLETEKSKIEFDKRAIYQMDLPENKKVEAKPEKVEEVTEEKVESTTEAK